MLKPPRKPSTISQLSCRLSCLDEELLLLRDREEIFCDMAELRSSEPISPQTVQATTGAAGTFFHLADELMM